MHTLNPRQPAPPAPMLDRFTASHLLAWSERQFRQPQEAAERLEIFLTRECDADEQAYWFEMGWPALGAHFAALYPEIYALFQS